VYPPERVPDEIRIVMPDYGFDRELIVAGPHGAASAMELKEEDKERRGTITHGT
jgi:hypothetical protein